MIEAANDEEAKVRAGTGRNPSAGRLKFGEYVNGWYARQDLAVSTMQNYRRTIEDHLLPAFESYAVASTPVTFISPGRLGSSKRSV